MKTKILRILALMLAIVLVLGCFAGCEIDTLLPNSDDEDQISDDPRDELEKHKYNGLTFYLSDEFEEDGDGEYISDDMSIIVAVMPLIDLEIDTQIDSTKDLLDYMQEIYEENGEELESHKENGVYYLVEHNGDFGTITGLYLTGQTVGLIIVEAEDLEAHEEEMILYATLGELRDYYKDHDEEPTFTPTEPMSPDISEPTFTPTEPMSPDISEPTFTPTEPTAAPTKPTVPDAPAQEKITLKVWTSSNDQQKSNNWLQKQLDAFQAAHPEYDITWDLGICPEGDIANTIKSDPAVAPDVYMLANDQIGTLVQAGTLTKLSGTYLKQVQNDNFKTLINTVTHTDNGVYGFPVANNCWYMFYNKDIFTEEDVKSLDAMLAKGKVAFDLANGWYNSAILFGNGCTLFGEAGNDASKGIDFAGQKAYDATAALIAFAADRNFVDCSYGSGFIGLMDGTVGACFTGSWDYDVLYDALGDKLGVCQPPKVTVGGKQVQMMSFAGSKAVGVNPNSKHHAVALQLAAFLASDEAQLDRYTMCGVIPCHTELASNSTILKDPCAAAEMSTIKNASVAQPAVPEMAYYWGPAGAFGDAILNKEVTMANYQDQVDLYNDHLNKRGL